MESESGARAYFEESESEEKNLRSRSPKIFFDESGVGSLETIFWGVGVGEKKFWGVGVGKKFFEESGVGVGKKFFEESESVNISRPESVKSWTDSAALLKSKKALEI